MRSCGKLTAVVGLAAMIVGSGIARAGHDSIEVDPFLKRYAGQVTALGAPDEQGRVYSFQAKRLPAALDFVADELRGWRLTMLAGKRFSHVFEVQSNTGTEVTVTPLDGPLNGVAPRDVFVVENIAIERPKSGPQQ
jgi:hypothetical protein